MPYLYFDLSLHTHVLVVLISVWIAAHLALSHLSYLTCPVFLAVFCLGPFGQKGLDVEGLTFGCEVKCCLCVCRSLLPFRVWPDREGRAGREA